MAPSPDPKQTFLSSLDPESEIFITLELECSAVASFKSS